MSAIRTLPLALVLALTASVAMPSSSKAADGRRTVHYRTVQVGGLDIFYREAGPKEAVRHGCRG